MRMPKGKATNMGPSIASATKAASTTLSSIFQPAVTRARRLPPLADQPPQRSTSQSAEKPPHRVSSMCHTLLGDLSWEVYRPFGGAFPQGWVAEPRARAWHFLGVSRASPIGPAGRCSLFPVVNMHAESIVLRTKERSALLVSVAMHKKTTKRCPDRAGNTCPTGADII
ncbi:uncharacterized protein SCHCODRAFT_02306064 [Schizophyllum commune H4-8]|uniref:uncharacterized protein n=1 Tax=Schizophyllum commune (strain H4-8 / FGSC 9210) TaxID=578458 RepID=UPI00215E92FD|nr:uncharacterized protein SCHCODRAFT_02306064 [Schizophyllum commune H4-8]KAI5890926.1 hypothetical protein SCHCODRAFT_02306064 [Schizophyllum commune H4-8]